VIRIKICRKESKECEFWLRLIKEVNTDAFRDPIDSLIKEAAELKKIFSTIVVKST
jgi:four helix bundle protein